PAPPSPPPRTPVPVGTESVPNPSLRAQCRMGGEWGREAGGVGGRGMRRGRGARQRSETARGTKRDSERTKRDGERNEARRRENEARRRRERSETAERTKRDGGENEASR